MITLTPTAITLLVVPPAVLRVPPGPILPAVVVLVVSPLGTTTAGRVADVPITPDTVVVEIHPVGVLFVDFVSVARGTLQLAESHLRNMLSESGEFQCWTKTADANEARSRIYYSALPRRGHGVAWTRESLETLRPYAILHTQAFRGEHYATDTRYRYIHGGVILIQLEQTIPAELLEGGKGLSGEDRAEMHVRFQNTVGRIMDDLENLSGLPDNLAFSGIEISEPWDRALDDDVPDVGHAQGVQVMVSWEQGQ